MGNQNVFISQVSIKITSINHKHNSYIKEKKTTLIIIQIFKQNMSVLNICIDQLY